MAADVQEVHLVAERSTKFPAGTWNMKALFVPTGMVGTNQYNIKFTLSDRNLSGLPALGSSHALFDQHQNGDQHWLELTIVPGGLVGDAVLDGGPSNRIDLVAHVEIFDPTVSDQQPVANRHSPGLDLFVD